MSVQGNCSVADVASSLSLAAEDAATLGQLLPLKPRQCVVVVQDTFLMVNRGNFWLDHVYLIVRRTRVQPSLAFFRIGFPVTSGPGLHLSPSDVVLSNVTMQGASRGWSRGIELTAEKSSLLLQGHAPTCSAAWPIHRRAIGISFRFRSMFSSRFP